MTLELAIYGPPTPKGRPRFAHGHTFTPQATKNAEKRIRDQWQYTTLEGAVAVEIEFTFKIPDSASKKRKEFMQKGLLKMTKRPDLDNCVKLVLDALNGKAYLDDSQIVSLRAHKHYGYEPKTVIKIQALEGEY